LEGKPVVVLSNNDGCSICQTKEAERFGFEMGSKAFEMEHIIKKYDIQVYSTNFTLIADMSLRVKSILKRYFTDLEDYSIDYPKLNIIESLNSKELIISVLISQLMLSAFD